MTAISSPLRRAEPEQTADLSGRTIVMAVAKPSCHRTHQVLRQYHFAKPLHLLINSWHSGATATTDVDVSTFPLPPKDKALSQCRSSRPQSAILQRKVLETGQTKTYHDL